MSSVLPKSWMERAADEGYRYGWLINLAVMAIMLAFASGGLNARVSDMGRQLDEIRHQLMASADQAAKTDDRMRILEQRLARVEGKLSLDSSLK